MENNDNIDEQQLESSVDEQEMKKAVDKKKMKKAVGKKKRKTDIDEQEWVTDDDEEQEEEEWVSDDDEHEQEEENVVDVDEEKEVEEIEMETESKVELDEQQQTLVSSFLEVVAGKSVETAIDYLQATNWKVEDAVRLYYSQDIRGGLWGSSQSDLPVDNSPQDDNDDNNDGSWQDIFHVAKQVAETQDRWLIVNVQSKKEFSSHELNLHTWGNEAVSQTIGANLIFWQVYDDVTEGQKVCNYYKLTSFPVILVLDPITGQKVKSWSGMVEAVQLLEDLAPFMDAGPKHHYAQLYPKRPSETSQTSEKQEAAAPVAPASIDIDELMIDEPVTSSSKKLTYPDLPEEPKVDKALLCRIGARLPDGRRLQRNFLKTDPLQLLWSFCISHLDEAESRPFQLTQAIPGASKILDFESKQTFEESGLGNSMIYFAWD
ncbi:plant UBX domain-containing protein 7-like [Papaver somniferum]|uniref:plant UBX domain-containing protein 7-like n=1 Tax=Papaver somniferum TaxID=3469 RepID=UPI000E6F8EF7|nr:plant UBX domain-containing protein 7-like [Papaver somniferum]